MSSSKECKEASGATSHIQDRRMRIVGIDNAFQSAVELPIRVEEVVPMGLLKVRRVVGFREDAPHIREAMIARGTAMQSDLPALDLQGTQHPTHRTGEGLSRKCGMVRCATDGPREEDHEKEEDDIRQHHRKQ